MLNDFTINYRGMEITPQLKHKVQYDVLCYEYMDKHVEVTFDDTMYDSSIKKTYIENVKYVACQGLDYLRKQDITNWYNSVVGEV